jgi:hypothetical protein
MGTDISMYVEIESNGTWQLLTEQDENTELQQREVYYGRQNYRLFAILANLRNPPIWGIVDDKPFDFIASTRGLPKDLSPELRDLSRAGDDNDVYSPSWLLLAEVLEFDWDGKVMIHQDLVDPALVHLFEESKPFPFDKLPQDMSMNYNFYPGDGVIVRWTETYAESAEDFMEFLDSLKKYRKPSQIRLVFWFGY